MLVVTSDKNIAASIAEVTSLKPMNMLLSVFLIKMTQDNSATTLKHSFVSIIGIYLLE